MTDRSSITFRALRQVLSKGSKKRLRQHDGNLNLIMILQDARRRRVLKASSVRLSMCLNVPLQNYYANVNRQKEDSFVADKIERDSGF